MTSSSNNLRPFVGDEVACRDGGERLNEEVYRSIPALTTFANALVAVGNKLAHDAREALFFEKGRDPGLRAVIVETAMVRHHQLNSVEPDLEWLRGAENDNVKTRRQDYESSENDIWLGPSAPGK